MKASPEIHDPAAEEQAALWATRLDGSTLDAADRARLDAWLGANPTHRTLLSQYCQFSANLETTLPLVVAAGNIAMPAIPQKPRRSFVAWFAGAGLAAAAAAVVAFNVWPAAPQTQNEKFATAVAQRRVLTLVDGSKVELNAHTSVAIETTRTERRVRLASGEAFFTVSKDPTRPFIVDTPGGSVRVTGTVFNVRNEPASPFEVTVVEGSVQVHPGESATRAAAPVPLTAGGRLSASAATGVDVKSLSADEIDDVIAWRQGQLVFNNAPLSEVLARIERHHGRGIKAVGDAAKLGVGGRFGIDDLDEFLRALESSFPVTATRDLSGNVLVSLRDAK